MVKITNLKCWLEPWAWSPKELLVVDAWSPKIIRGAAAALLGSGGDGESCWEAAVEELGLRFLKMKKRRFVYSLCWVCLIFPDFLVFFGCLIGSPWVKTNSSVKVFFKKLGKKGGRGKTGFNRVLLVHWSNKTQIWPNSFIISEYLIWFGSAFDQLDRLI